MNNNSRNKNDPLKPRWSDPSELNGDRRFVKVSITSTKEDEATIFIILSQPNMPEFSVNNYTDKEIRFYQKGLKGYNIDWYCKPAVHIDFANSKSNSFTKYNRSKA